MGSTAPGMSMETAIRNGQIVNSLQSAMRDGASGLRDFPALLKRIIRERMWSLVYVESIKACVEFKTFSEFVSAGPPEGLGADVRTLKHLCRDDTEALDLLDVATQTPNGGDRRSEQAAISFDNVKTEAPTGNSRDAALRRLRKDRPDLHALVISGEMSANSAMVEAGFRKRLTVEETLRKTFAKIDADQQFSHLRTLIEQATPEARAALRVWLSECEDETP